LLELGDKQALDLELMFLTREPKEAFAVFDEDGWNAWLDFFSSVRYREEERKGVVHVRIRSSKIITSLEFVNAAFSSCKLALNRL